MIACNYRMVTLVAQDVFNADELTVIHRRNISWYYWGKQQEKRRRVRKTIKADFP